MEDRPYDPRWGDEGMHHGREEMKSMDENMAMSSGSSEGGEETYGLLERQIVFKLIAAHAMVDPEFYKLLRGDPAAAVAQMHLVLADDDMEYLKGIVDWPVLDEHAEAVRQALHTEAVVRSLW
jgi:hypothetical protein